MRSHVRVRVFVSPIQIRIDVILRLEVNLFRDYVFEWTHQDRVLLGGQIGWGHPSVVAVVGPQVVDKTLHEGQEHEVIELNNILRLLIFAHVHPHDDILHNVLQVGVRVDVALFNLVEFHIDDALAVGVDRAQDQLVDVPLVQ